MGEGNCGRGDGSDVGAHLVGHAAEELINLFAMAMEFGITASQIRSMIYAFPTFSADIKSTL
jgi:glutathione reductase (NADPH)